MIIERKQEERKKGIDKYIHGLPYIRDFFFQVQGIILYLFAMRHCIVDLNKDCSIYSTWVKIE